MTRYSKRIITSILIIIMMVYSVPIQADVIPFEGLKQVEKQLYGNVSDAAILQKVDTLELAVFGHKTKGSIANRAQELIDYIFPANNSQSLVLLIPYMENNLYNEIKNGSIVKRIEDIELSIYGEIQKGALVTRVEKLTRLLVPADTKLIKEVQVPQGKEIHIQIENEINTNNLKAGQLINFSITNDIVIDEYMIIPAGTTGDLEVTEFKEAGNFGKDASIKIRIKDIKTIDGSLLSLDLKLDDKENYSKEMAVGVGLLSTVIISNPIGLVAGYFLKGKDLVIPVGTVIKTQVYESKDVYGISM